MTSNHNPLPVRQALGLLRSYLNERPPLISWPRVRQVAQDAGPVGWDYLAAVFCQNPPDDAMFAWLEPDTSWLRPLLTHQPRELEPTDIAAALEGQLGQPPNALIANTPPYDPNLHRHLQNNPPTTPSHIDLSTSILGDEGLAFITEHIDLKCTKSLRLAHSGITPNGVEYLTTFQPSLPHLQHLDLSGLTLSVQCAKHLVQTLQAPRLHCIHLHNSFTPPRALDVLRSRWTVLQFQPKTSPRALHCGPYTVELLPLAECYPRFSYTFRNENHQASLQAPRLSSSLQASLTRVHNPDEALYNLGSLSTYTNLARWNSPHRVSTPYIHIRRNINYRRPRPRPPFRFPESRFAGTSPVLFLPNGVPYRTFIQGLGGEVTPELIGPAVLNTSAALTQCGRLVGVFCWSISNIEYTWVPILSRSYIQSIALAQGYTGHGTDRSALVWEIGRASMELSTLVARAIFDADDTLPRALNIAAERLHTVRNMALLREEVPYLVWDPPRFEPV